MGHPAGTSGSLQRLFRWWVDELAGLVPAAARELARGSERRIVIAPDASGVSVLEERRGRAARLVHHVEGAALGEAAAKLVLSELARARPRCPVGLRLPRGSCLIRRMELPAAARPDFAAMLALELERATPFRPDEVFTGYASDGEPARDGRIGVRHVIAKREPVERLVREAEAAGLKIDFVDCWREDGNAGLGINLLAPAPAAAPERVPRLARPLASVAVLIALAAGTAMLALDLHERALDRLMSESARTKNAAIAARRDLERGDAALAELVELAGIKSRRTPVVLVLEELSRLLPDTAWLGDLRIDGDTVDLTGHTASANALIATLEGSGLLKDVVLTSPAVFDAGSGRERFSMRASIRPHGPPRAAATGTGGGR